jgi:hypothetical protein
MNTHLAVSAHSVIAVLGLVLSLTEPYQAALQEGARALYADPRWEQPSPNVNAWAARHVGIYCWFENAGGERFADTQVPMGQRVRLRIRPNVAGFLTVWQAAPDGPGEQLTPMDGRYFGHRLAVDKDYTVDREFLVTSSPLELLVLFARSQTEQVASVAMARDKLAFLRARTLPDGGSALVRETETRTPGAIGTYIVHRTGAQAGGELIVGSRR